MATAARLSTSMVADSLSRRSRDAVSACPAKVASTSAQITSFAVTQPRSLCGTWWEAAVHTPDTLARAPGSRLQV